MSLPTAATLRRVDRAASRLATVATERMVAELPWFPGMSAEHRSWVGIVAQSGIASFAAWLHHPQQPPVLTGSVFGSAPRELARAVSLGQTVDAVRMVVSVVEDEVPALAGESDEPALREAILLFSREIAFAAAGVYAKAAEERGAWDARVEALVVDTVVRGDADTALASRAGALGWPGDRRVIALVGTAPGGNATADEDALDELRRAAGAARLAILTGMHGEALVAVLGLPPTIEPPQAAGALARCFGTGSVIYGPSVDGLAAAHHSVQAALEGWRVAPAWPSAGRLVHSDELLPERALNGDTTAREELVTRFVAPLEAAGKDLLATALAVVEHGGAVEAASRTLFVHPNTLRYRSRRIAVLTGVSLATPRGRFTAQIALALGRLTELRPT